ncbi:MAG: sulfite exporter TauE/SafE family protein [Gammaproteobacteria bacterium]|nr:sulfite exporter TauE/SafE family protein [Gammaproteobacteria bacterium]
MQLSALLVAFGLGLLSTLHCWGMCGALLSVFALHGGVRAGPAPAFRLALAYNLGRIASYTAVGALVGWVAGVAIAVSAPRWGHQFLQMLAAGVLIASGLVILNVLPLPMAVRRVGFIWWRHLQPLSRAWLPIDSLGKAFGVGLVWGWLPCGLVYSMLALAATQAAVAPAAAIMLAFGLGTLPGMLLASQLFERFKRHLAQDSARRVGGIALVTLGLAFIALALPHAMHMQLGHRR